MGKKTNPYAFLDIKAQGEELTTLEGKKYFKWFWKNIYTLVSERRKGKYLLHNTLQNEAGIWLQSFGWDVEYEVPFSQGGFSNEKVRFDIVAERKKELWVIEIKDELTHRDTGQVHVYANYLQSRKQKGKVWLGIDLLAFDELLRNEPLVEAVGELMNEEDIGLMLIDKHVIVFLHNINYLNATVLPELYFVDENDKIGGLGK